MATEVLPEVRPSVPEQSQSLSERPEFKESLPAKERHRARYVGGILMLGLVAWLGVWLLPELRRTLLIKRM